MPGLLTFGGRIRAKSLNTVPRIAIHEFIQLNVLAGSIQMMPSRARFLLEEQLFITAERSIAPAQIQRTCPAMPIFSHSKFRLFLGPTSATFIGIGKK